MSYVNVRQSWTIVQPNARPKNDNVATLQKHEDKTDEPFNIRMQRMRIRSSISLNVLATTLSITPSSLASMERGDEIPSEDVQRRILFALKVE